MLKLSEPQFELRLRNWGWSQNERLAKGDHALQQIANGESRTPSRAFKEATKQLKAYSRNPQQITALLGSRLYQRALFSTLSNSAAFRRSFRFNTEVLEALNKSQVFFGKFSLTQLARYFFQYYDEIGDVEAINRLGRFIMKQLDHQFSSELDSGRRATSGLAKYYESGDQLFNAEGAKNVARNALLNGEDLELHIRKRGMSGLGNSRFLLIARAQYYLAQLSELPVGASSPLLAEVQKQEVYNLPSSYGRLLGHEILQVLIDRAGSTVSDAWLNTVIEIAGDPRVNALSQDYQRWWRELGDERLNKVRGWLSKTDLKLFLQILEESAKHSSALDMERMFQSRKDFMEALVEQGVVVDSRIIMSTEAKEFIARSNPDLELPRNLAEMRGNTSAIYLNLENKVHFLEGSHSFKLKMMDRVPSECKFHRHDVKEIKDTSLRAVVGFFYNREFGTRESHGAGSNEKYRELTHNGNWVLQATHFLIQQGVNITPGKTLKSDVQLMQYKQMFGAGY